jgi:hypothetical protein
MKVSGQLHAPARFMFEKEFRCSLKKEGGQATEPG